jgi:hypothetical protein
MMIDWIKCKIHGLPIRFTLSENEAEEVLAVDGECEEGCEFFKWVHPQEDLINCEDGSLDGVTIGE